MYISVQTHRRPKLKLSYRSKLHSGMINRSILSLTLKVVVHLMDFRRFWIYDYRWETNRSTNHTLDSVDLLGKKNRKRKVDKINLLLIIIFSHRKLYTTIEVECDDRVAASSFELWDRYKYIKRNRIRFYYHKYSEKLATLHRYFNSLKISNYEQSFYHQFYKSHFSVFVCGMK